MKTPTHERRPAPSVQIYVQPDDYPPIPGPGGRGEELDSTRLPGTSRRGGGSPAKGRGHPAVRLSSGHRSTISCRAFTGPAACTFFKPVHLHAQLSNFLVEMGDQLLLGLARNPGSRTTPADDPGPHPSTTSPAPDELYTHEQSAQPSGPESNRTYTGWTIAKSMNASEKAKNATWSGGSAHTQFRSALKAQKSSRRLDVRSFTMGARPFGLGLLLGD